MQVCRGSLICGVDEAGRGPVAGPVCAAAVVLAPNHPINGLADSKKLSEAARDRLAPLIQTHALAYAIAWASVEEIDTLNILQASLLAMQRAVEDVAKQLGHLDEVLVDGNRCPKLAFPARAIVRGDSLVAEISAASILAKTARDALMRELHDAYPQYGLNQHKGYPTAAHLSALTTYGVVPIYRKTFGPVRRLLEETR